LFCFAGVRKKKKQKKMYEPPVRVLPEGTVDGVVTRQRRLWRVRLFQKQVPTGTPLNAPYILNRDTNAILNFFRFFLSHIKTGTRPAMYCYGSTLSFIGDDEASESELDSE
jgi:hypothetical protein